MRPSYELGQQIEVQLHILDPDLLQQLPEQISVQIVQKGKGPANDLTVGQQVFERKSEQNDLYVASWTADRAGRFSLQLPALAGATEPAETPIVVKIPRLELTQPQVDRDLLSKLATRDLTPAADSGLPDVQKLRIVAESDLPVVRAELTKIPSAAVTVPDLSSRLLWNAPLAMLVFVLLITIEWVLRKVYGML